MKNIALAVAVVLLTACGGGSTSGGTGQSNGAVSWTRLADGSLRCNAPSRVSMSQFGSRRYMTCVWFCSDYKQYRRAYVSVTFIKDGNRPSEFSRDYVSGGICNRRTA